MNHKKFWMAALVVFLMWFVLDTVIHGMLLQDLYRQSAHLWRPLADMQRMGWILWLVDAAMAVIFVWIFAKGLEAGKSYAGQGLRFGIVIGLMFSLPMAFSMYAVSPIPFALALGWFTSGLFEFAVAGLLAGLIYRPK